MQKKYKLRLSLSNDNSLYKEKSIIHTTTMVRISGNVSLSLKIHLVFSNPRS